MTAPTTLHPAIFRHTLFLPSERFIPDQAAALPMPATMVARDRVQHHVERLRATSIYDHLGRRGVYQHVAGDPRPLAGVLRDVGADVLHAHFGVEGVFSRRAAAMLDIPHFTTFHGFDATLTTKALLRGRNASWLRYALSRDRFIKRGGTELICVSEALKRRLVSAGAPERAIHVIGTGVDTRAIRPVPAPDRPVVLHVARLVEKKGTAFLIAAVAELAKEIPEIELRIVGDGPLGASLRSLAADLGIAHAVRFLGVQPHAVVIREIQGSTLLCLPSVTASTGDEEGLGQVLLEAAAAARPVVATSHGGITDAVVDGETGILVAERNASQLADALRVVLNSSQVAARLGAAGREHAVANFDLVTQAAKLAVLYRRTVSG